MGYLTGYHLLWVLVMFDLPVVEQKDRKEATKFRKSLLDMGFEMTQFSVYIRFCGKREKAGKYTRKIKEKLPNSGNVSIIFITDKQFGNIINFENRKKRKNKESNQMSIFDIIDDDMLNDIDM